MWVQVFQLALAFDTMTRWKSCRHKTCGHLILNWFRAGGSDLIGRRQGIQRQGQTDRQKSLWIENAARPRNRPVSQNGVHLTRAEIYPEILLRRLFQRSVLANGKNGSKTTKVLLSPLQNRLFVMVLRTRGRIVPASRLLIRSLLGISERVRLWTTVVGRTPLLESST